MASLQNVHEGDIVLVDKKGRRAHCLVVGKLQRELQLRPITHGFTYRSATSHEVIEHWRKTKNTVRRRSTGNDA